MKGDYWPHRPFRFRQLPVHQNGARPKLWSGWAERSMMFSRAAVKEWEERIGSVASGYKDEAGFLDGMAKETRNREHLERQMYACHKANIAARTKMNEFMAARLGKVVVQDGQLMFNTQDEINTYNEYVEEINRQAQLLADFQQRYLQGLQQELMNISELAR